MKIAQIIGENLDQFIQPSQMAYLAKVRKAMTRISSDWNDEYKNNAVLTAAIQRITKQIMILGAINTNQIMIWRAELRPLVQIQAQNFSSLGGYWTWHSNSPQVMHHDNAYDEFHEINSDDLHEITFEAEARLIDIDWPTTIAQNIILPQEREITMKNNSIVHVHTLYTNDDEFNVNFQIRVVRMDWMD